MLRADHLEMTFNPGTPIENRVLRGLDLEIPTGQFVTVIGSNGAGKSTFLNAVSGDLIVDQGSIEIDGKDVTRMNAWQRSGVVARVFQDPMAGTCEALTIEENMALAWKRGERRGFGFALNRNLRGLFREKLSILKLGLENRLTDHIGLLSGGQRQAVAIGRAVSWARKVIILDEPTNHLGARQAKEVLEVIRRLSVEDGLTMIISTHQLRFADEVADRVVFLSGGSIIEEGPAHEVLTHPRNPITQRFLSVMEADRPPAALS